MLTNNNNKTTPPLFQNNSLPFGDKKQPFLTSGPSTAPASNQLFGGNNQNNNTSTSLFGQNQSSNLSGSLFGGKSAQNTTPQNAPATGTNQLFSNNTNTANQGSSTGQAGLFNNVVKTPSAPAGNLFGQNQPQNSTAPTTLTSQPSFGQGGLFANKNTTTTTTAPPNNAQNSSNSANTGSQQPQTNTLNFNNSSTTNNGLFGNKQPAKIFTNAQTAQNQAQSKKVAPAPLVNSPLFNNSNKPDAQAQNKKQNNNKPLFGNTISQGPKIQAGGMFQNNTITTPQTQGQTANTQNNNNVQTTSPNLFSNNGGTSVLPNSGNSGETKQVGEEKKTNLDNQSTGMNQTQVPTQAQQNPIQKIQQDYERSNQSISQYIEKWKQLQANCLKQICNQSQRARQFLKDREQNFRIRQNFQKLKPVIQNSKQSINSSIQKIERRQIQIINILTHIKEELDHDANQRYFRQSQVSAQIRSCLQIRKQINAEDDKLTVDADNDQSNQQLKNIFFNLDLVQTQIRRLSHIVDHYFGKYNRI